MTLFLTVEIQGNLIFKKKHYSGWARTLDLSLSLSLSLSLALSLSLSACEENLFFLKNSCSRKIILSSEQLIFWPVEIIFFHFLRQQSTAVSESSFFFSQNLFFSQSFIPTSENDFFVYQKQYFFYSKFLFTDGKYNLNLGEVKF